MLAAAAMVGFVPTTDLEASIAFYRDVLGLEFVQNDGFAGVFRSNGQVLRVVAVETFEPQAFSVAGWRVADVGAAAAWLRDRGVELLRFPGMEQDELGVWTPPGGTAGVAWFRDPAGNTLSISGG